MTELVTIGEVMSVEHSTARPGSVAVNGMGAAMLERYAPEPAELLATGF
jgi:hypothetical protein